jgi:hypothetical protein
MDIQLLEQKSHTILLNRIGVGNRALHFTKDNKYNPLFEETLI